MTDKACADKSNVKINPYYDMNHKHRGFALIFNHEVFQEMQETENVILPKRKATNVDSDRLEYCLKEMGFEVEVLNDPNYLNLTTTLERYSQMDHSDNDCFLVAVLTHGNEGILYANDRSYKYEQLWNPFLPSNCPSLEGKPKIFIIQACRGEMLDDGTTLYKFENNNLIENTATPSDELDSGKIIDGNYFPYQLMHEPDFLIAFSTPPGHFSFRNSKEGTWFVYELCNEIETNGREQDLLTLLTTVNGRVSFSWQSNVPTETEKHNKKQVPCFSHTFLRLCLFAEKNKKKAA